jgi:hypothetical protein
MSSCDGLAVGRGSGHATIQHTACSSTAEGNTWGGLAGNSIARTSVSRTNEIGQTVPSARHPVGIGLDIRAGGQKGMDDNARCRTATVILAGCS